VVATMGQTGLTSRISDVIDDWLVCLKKQH
jgi:hypothetical protein